MIAPLADLFVRIGHHIGHVREFTSSELEYFVNDYNRYRELRHHPPLFRRQRGQLEDIREEVNLKDDEVKTDTHDHGSQQPKIHPWRHHHERLILGQAVHGIEHFNQHQHGQGHGHWLRVAEDVAVNTVEIFVLCEALHVMCQLVIVELRTLVVDREPPGS